jgi:hypothetical protein
VIQVRSSYTGAVRSRLIALAAVSAVTLVPAAHAHPQTTDPTVFVDIKVTITDTRITVNPNSVPRGQYARFFVHNIGTKVHSFALGKPGAKAGTGVQTGFSRTVKPKEQKLLLLYLDYRGQLPYYSTVPADRSKPGMRGIFTIT